MHHIPPPPPKGGTTNNRPEAKRQKNLVGRALINLKTKCLNILRFTLLASSLRSRRRHKAWRVSPRGAIVKDTKPTKWATISGCRPFHWLDGAPDLTRGYAFGPSPG
jgi:hypothetical protein